MNRAGISLLLCRLSVVFSNESHGPQETSVLLYLTGLIGLEMRDWSLLGCWASQGQIQPPQTPKPPFKTGIYCQRIASRKPE